MPCRHFARPRRRISSTRSNTALKKPFTTEHTEKDNINRQERQVHQEQTFLGVLGILAVILCLRCPPCSLWGKILYFNPPPSARYRSIALVSLSNCVCTMVCWAANNSRWASSTSSELAMPFWK